MKFVQVQAWCDHPECVAVRTKDSPAQETRPIHYWVYTPGRGRKPRKILVDMCAEHEAEMKEFYQALLKYDQSSKADQVEEIAE